jgi:RNA polymerase primary sigma factor
MRIQTNEPYVDGYEAIYRNERRNMFEDALSTLTDREREIITERFGLEGGRPKTLQELAEKYGITREGVRWHERKAMRKLRHPTRSKKLQKFMEDLYK